MKIDKQVSWSRHGRKKYIITMFFDETEREEMLMNFKKEIDIKSE